MAAGFALHRAASSFASQACKALQACDSLSNLLEVLRPVENFVRLAAMSAYVHIEDHDNSCTRLEQAFAHVLQESRDVAHGSVVIDLLILRHLEPIAFCLLPGKASAAAGLHCTAVQHNLQSAKIPS